jgi:hypothetical protein
VVVMGVWPGQSNRSVTPVTATAPRLWTSPNMWWLPSALWLLLSRAISNGSVGVAATAAVALAVVPVVAAAVAVTVTAVTVAAAVAVDNWGEGVRKGVNGALEAVADGAARVSAPGSGWQAAADKARTTARRAIRRR